MVSDLLHVLIMHFYPTRQCSFELSITLLYEKKQILLQPMLLQVLLFKFRYSYIKASDVTCYQKSLYSLYLIICYIHNCYIEV